MLTLNEIARYMWEGGYNDAKQTYTIGFQFWYSDIEGKTDIENIYNICKYMYNGGYNDSKFTYCGFEYWYSDIKK